jgi:hypothetical protein
MVTIRLGHLSHSNDCLNDGRESISTVQPEAEARAPQQLPSVPLQVAGTEGSILIKSRSLNLRVMQAGHFNQGNFVGLIYGVSLPHVQVTRFNGNCYLSNGFHRMYGLGRAGATRLPCLFRDVTAFQAVGIKEDGSTFRLPLLEGPNPPTCRHFIEDRAHPVSLRATTRIIHVSWSDYAIPDE